MEAIKKPAADKARLEKKVRFKNLKKLAKIMIKDKIIVMSLSESLFCNFVFALLLIFMGIMAMISSPDPERIQIRYDTQCSPQTLTPENRDKKCSLKFRIHESFKGPVLVHLGFEDLFIFHRMVEGSKSIDQISHPADTGDMPSECEKNPPNGFFGKKTTFLDNDDVDVNRLYPCGIYASLYPKGQRLGLKKGDMEYYIRDDFRENMMEFGKQGDAPIGRNGARRWKGVNGWSSSKNRFVNAKRTGLSSKENLHWVNVLDDRFLKWMTGPIASTVWVLWGIVEKDMPKGEYTIDIYDFYNANSYGVKKYVSLRSKSDLSVNPNTALASIIVGAILLSFNIISYVVNVLMKRRSESDGSIRKILKTKKSVRNSRDVTRKKLEILEVAKESEEGHVKVADISLEKKVSFFNFEENEGEAKEHRREEKKKAKKSKKDKSSIRKKKKKKKGKSRKE